MESATNSKAKKVILISRANYCSEHDEFLETLIKRKIELFCAVGTDCEKWEEALDWLCIEENGEEISFINTTSHPNETLEKVEDFARNWCVDGNDEIQIVKI